MVHCLAKKICPYCKNNVITHKGLLSKIHWIKCPYCKTPMYESELNDNTKKDA
jgi:acetyl-CoA carboxylase beta subunit